MDQIIAKIEERKTEMNAVILAHNYQRCEIQQLADYTGDSLGLSRQAVEHDCDVIIFCGVDFMAESAAILSPDKQVLLPAKDAHCPMAAMVDVSSLRKAKAKNPDAAVVCYVNSSAAVKAESDICCTSSNAVNVVNSLKEDKVIFVPDKNLAHYVSLHTEKQIISWEGYCPVHHQIMPEEIIMAKQEHPDAEFLAHPECRPDVVEMADAVLSTSGIIERAGKPDVNEFIIGTENGILCRLKEEHPDKTFYFASPFASCANMKMVTPSILLDSMEKMQYEVTVEESVREKAKKALDRMLEI